MPHSSGGGSCGGGTHGGSSSSSSSGSHGTRNYKYSSRAFPGATRYTYVDSRGRFRSFYANQDPATAVTSGPLIYGLLGFFFLLPIGIVLLTGIHNPKKLELSYDNKILIDDRAGLLSETEKTRLTGTFRDFYDESGVTPSFFTVLDSEWKENHASLEGFAFKEYVRSFDDECHWLFVYSVNDGEPAWSFEGMQGDDTDKVLDTVFTSDFNTRLYDALMDESLTVGEAVDKTFADSVHTVMNFRFGVEPFEWIIVPVFDGFILLCFISVLKTDLRIRAYQNYHKTNSGTAAGGALTCPYCGVTYADTGSDRCPKCNRKVR